MKPTIHVALSIIIALFLYPFYSLKVLFILIGGILIDFDHYLYYIIKFKDSNFLRCYKYYVERMEKNRVYENIGILLIFHSLEFYLLIIILSFFSNIFFLFLIGLVSHYILDLIWNYYKAKRLIPNPSIIHFIAKSFIKNKKNIESFARLFRTRKKAEQ